MIEWLIDWLIDWMVLLINWFIDWLIYWYIDILIDWLIDWLNKFLNDWLIDWLIKLISMIDWWIKPALTYTRNNFSSPETISHSSHDKTNSWQIYKTVLYFPSEGGVAWVFQGISLGLRPWEIPWEDKHSILYYCTVSGNGLDFPVPKDGLCFPVPRDWTGFSCP